MFFNILPYITGGVIALPSKVGKALPNGALLLALLLLLSVNPKLKIRPNVFLFLVGLLVFDGILTASQQTHPGTFYRTFRFIEILVCFWLMTPWWDRSDMLLLRWHLRVLYGLVVSVVIGMLVAPGKSYQQGRLAGAVWPVVPTQLAEYSAVAAGLTILLWLGHRVSGRAASIGVAGCLLVLVLTHTRTALLGLGTGILVAGLSLFAANARVRRFFAWSALIAAIATVSVAGVITTWLARGQNAQGLSSLSGRTDFWGLVLNEPRNPFQLIFGFDLSHTGVNGLPIDSNWLSAYQQEGLFGVGLCAAILIFLLIAAFFQPPGIRRATILFLTVYCLLASFTEDAFATPTGYLLQLFIAASLLGTSSSGPPEIMMEAAVY
jgi:hypothetical protein